MEGGRLEPQPCSTGYCQEFGDIRRTCCCSLECGLFSSAHGTTWNWHCDRAGFVHSFPQVLTLRITQTCSDSWTAVSSREKESKQQTQTKWWYFTTSVTDETRIVEGWIITHYRCCINPSETWIYWPPIMWLTLCKMLSEFQCVLTLY